MKKQPSSVQWSFQNCTERSLPSETLVDAIVGSNAPQIIFQTGVSVGLARIGISFCRCCALSQWKHGSGEPDSSLLASFISSDRL
ncbi:Os10g0433700 [Oryza sativa Japonica Group]|uniref:Os10g0433700 protein n=2 Tax=Oryza sativa subsp. japonica TaxID=39947 RepID=C7J819_ORYSJ|nr:hypothetical protein OsJ_31624 [Oryza sativa Japonica Group]BAH94897.1 Os10g0433700 [Oryza sativa Japonica Group]BAT10971.1 Os10g0433700 [Oryza sativa Japonica Group]|eukprot:NP_001176169.1 Os10g0433700 [Oryza sativa Japonica Group]